MNPRSRCLLQRCVQVMGFPLLLGIWVLSTPTNAAGVEYLGEFHDGPRLQDGVVDGSCANWVRMPAVVHGEDRARRPAS